MSMKRHNYNNYKREGSGTGGDLGGTGGTVPHKILGWDGPCINLPPYFEKYCYWMWDKVRTD